MAPFDAGFDSLIGCARIALPINMNVLLDAHNALVAERAAEGSEPTAAALSRPVFAVLRYPLSWRPRLDEAMVLKYSILSV